MRIDELQKIGVTIFGSGPVTIRLPEVIPVFHRWIQNRDVEGLLIDVADYSHVPDGPGILLIAHEGDYSLGIVEGRIALTYLRKRPTAGLLVDRITAVVRAALRASREIENAPELGGRVRFRTDEIRILANDRLLAPNTEESLAGIRPFLEQLLSRLYGAAERQLSRDPDPGERFAVHARIAASTDLESLVRRAA